MTRITSRPFSVCEPLEGAALLAERAVERRNSPLSRGVGCSSQLLRTNSRETTSPHLRTFRFAPLENPPLDTKSASSWWHRTRLTGGEEPAVLTGAGLGTP